MAEMILVKQAAARWGLTERSITGMCRSGKIPGAYKAKGSWYLPADSAKPKDGRVRTGAYKKPTGPRRKLPLPVGISDYRTVSTKYYYVDQTLLIRDFLDERPMVSLFTRPRRFGKTLNMDMLRTFFEKTEEDTSVYFRNKAIWKQGKLYRSYQGKYPVIFVTFKDTEGRTWEETFEKIARILGEEFSRHSYLLSSPNCSETDKTYFRQVLERTASEPELTAAFRILTRMLHEHAYVAPVIIIDEYDTPILQGYRRGFYEKVVLFLRQLFAGGLNDNMHLSFGFLAGILRAANGPENGSGQGSSGSVFSGLNNLTINSVLDDMYSDYFGFTPTQLRAMARYYDAEDSFDELIEWYGGYRFGRSDLLNPWSVVNYFRSHCRPGAYWHSTGNNEIIGDVIAKADPKLYEQFHTLLGGQKLLSYIDTGIIRPQIEGDPSSVYSYLLVAGYLKAIKADTSFTSGYMCEVAIPNREIASVYRGEILEKLAPLIPRPFTVSIREALFSGNITQLRKELANLLMHSASAFDPAPENVFPGFVLGLCAVTEDCFRIQSSRPEGSPRFERFEIALFPKEDRAEGRLPGILIDLTAAKKADHTNLQVLAREEIAQMDDQPFAAQMRAEGIESIIKYEAAFSGRRVVILMQ